MLEVRHAPFHSYGGLSTSYMTNQKRLSRCCCHFLLLVEVFIQTNVITGPKAEMRKLRTTLEKERGAVKEKGNKDISVAYFYFEM